jgi:hypothetical protein
LKEFEDFCGFSIGAGPWARLGASVLGGVERLGEKFAELSFLLIHNKSQINSRFYTYVLVLSGRCKKRIKSLRITKILCLRSRKVFPPFFPHVKCNSP